MTSQHNRHDELEQRERLLREKEVEIRLREMEQKMSVNDTPFHQTVKHQTENSPKPWVKKLIIAGKLFALGVAALVAVRVASVLAGFVIMAVLAWVAYKLFFETRKK
ncbi:Protein of unknown function (DUF3040) [Nostoc sp. PCC 7524]|uniref:DUF3040 domain-containing protein n=1 Tax=Nostoc sp. (strain ATCC 29411 / PCC 7524) TaxID=28072 RepID=UPI00029EE59F|nr:DUF3040 domain-containing protein [Nostoc sp. PCC 7524]AFY45956.1 Protein of unknown function (DUF3040) [Nostoc sp. PCC 7524]